MRRLLRAAACCGTMLFAFDFGAAQAADLVWQVENPFRFYRHAKSFAIHEAAFNAIHPDRSMPVPADIVRRIERYLNDPHCSDPSTPARCQDTIINGDHGKFVTRQLGWASAAIDDVCYERNRLPRQMLANCAREGRPQSENYVLPTGHSVRIALAPERLAEVGSGQCTWTWQPRGGGARSQPRQRPCNAEVTIEQVPYVARDEAASGVSVEVLLPDGRKLSEPNVVVKDILVAALGDSFASGEGNPDRPVRFSGAYALTYEPETYRDADCTEVAAAMGGLPGARRRPAPIDFFKDYSWRSLPRRLLENESARKPCPTTNAFRQIYERRNAEWLSADCHRSQYSYAFRVAIQIALEDRHRAVTLIPLACTGAEVTAGLFQQRDPRERSGNTKVESQFVQLRQLICEPGGPSKPVEYRLPTADPRDTQVGRPFDIRVTMQWCPEQRRRRDIDLVLLSIGGNDVGFGALAAYSILNNLGEIGWVAGLLDSELRFGPERADKYLNFLDRRIKAVKDALSDGFGLTPERVVHTSYEPLQFDEEGHLCGDPSLDMNVHPAFKLDRGRLANVSGFVDKLLNRLQCISKEGAGCPSGLATGQGTGFRLVVKHQPEFMKRGICARDPGDANGLMMAMPRLAPNGDGFKPYLPFYFTPYSHRVRLFRTPNDAFLTANTHREGTILVDKLQPAFAALYSGAFHPTAEAHSIVADYTMVMVRCVLDMRTTAECE